MSEYQSLGGERHRHEYQGQALEHQHPDGAKPHHYFGHPEDFPVVHLEGEIPVELSLAPAAEGPAWEWPAEPVTVVSDQGGQVTEIPTVSCRRCQAEIHLADQAQPDGPWQDWACGTKCAGTELVHEPEWSIAQLERDFEVRGFALRICVVRRRSDGKLGSLDFGGQPRRYVGWHLHEHEGCDR